MIFFFFNEGKKKMGEKTYGQLIDIDLNKVNVGELGGHLVEFGLHHLTRTTPGGREIDHQLHSIQF